MAKRRIQLGNLCLLLSVGALAVGCAQQEESILVKRVIAMDGECAANASSPTNLAAGIVDLSFDTGYSAWFEVKNNLIAQTPTATGSGVDTSEMYLDGVDVTLSTPQDSSLSSLAGASGDGLMKFHDAVASESFAGQQSIAAYVDIPPDTFTALGSAISSKYGPDQVLDLEMSVVFHAVRASNVGVNDFGVIDAREFTLPIQMCFGCLRDCSACADSQDCLADPDVGLGLCGNAQDGAAIPASCAATMDP